MANSSIIAFFNILLLLVSGRIRSSESMAQKTWCVARPSTDPQALQENIQYACTQVDCKIMATGPCFSPNTLISHASVVMNLYYQSRGRNYWNCHFGGSGIITISDPSYGDCLYA